MKKLIAMLLAAIMAISVLPAAAFAAEDNGSTGPVWPEEGSIKLDKDAKAVEGRDNFWEVTLRIQGKNYKTTSDVVLVIDCSGSMDGSKLTNTRKAAKAFGEKLLAKGSSTRIAIVTYIDEAAAYNNGHFYTADELAAFNTAVDAATYADGGTNQQAGIHKAQELLTSAASTGKTKSIVILSDGEATYSHPFTATATYSNCEAWTSIGCPRGGSLTGISAFTPNYNKIIGEGDSFNMSYNAEVSARCSKHDKTSTHKIIYNLDGTHTAPGRTNNGVATIWEANRAKAAGTTIYSVALQAGTNGENTLKACASDAAKGYFAIAANETDVAGKLTEAFTSIAGSIAIAAKNGVVNDAMGEKIDLAFSGGAPVITTDEAVYNAGNADIYISQGTAAYDAAARRINWNVGNVNEGDNPTLKYRVEVKEGYYPSTNETLLTNEWAKFIYTDYKDEEVVGDFPKPEVTVGGGKILVHYYMVNGEGQPINEAGVAVESPSLAKQVKDAEYFSYNGSTGLNYNTPYTVSKENIANYSYAGKYILNEGSLTEGNSVEVTLTAANSNQHVWFAYTQEFTVVHIQDGSETGRENYSVSAGFNMTEHVTAGYLYGGTFSNADCTAVADFNGGNPTDFIPKAGETYYIWEVDKAYLVPKSLSCWEHNAEGLIDVMGFYLIAPIDREYYSEVGFTVNGVKVTANQISSEYSSGSETVTLYEKADRAVLYRKIVINRKDGGDDSYDITSVTDKTKGYLACYGVDKAGYWNEAGAEITFIPYWVTLDGVEVTNGIVRTCKYLGAGSGSENKLIGKIGETETTPVISYEGAAYTKAMAVFSMFIADGSPINSAAPAEPEQPEQPE